MYAGMELAKLNLADGLFKILMYFSLEFSPPVAPD